MLTKKQIFLGLGIILPLLFLLNKEGIAQKTQREVVQLSGLVVTKDSSKAIPGAHIYVPGTGRGTSTDNKGYFSLPVLKNDTLLVTAVGFRRQKFVVPEDINVDNYTQVFELETDTTFLENVDIFPFPTEKHFKEAILALELPNKQRRNYMEENLNEEILARMFENMPMDGSMNHTYYMNRLHNQLHTRGGPPSNPLLNPFAWAELIKSIKNGDFLEDKEKED